MTTATAQDRLRQIAILVSCVDATAGRQILLHLPTDKARRVRAMASQLGTVPPEEKRKILAEFQRSAASAEDRPAERSSPVSKPVSGAAAMAHTVGHQSEPTWTSSAGANDFQSTPPNSWMQLKPAALVRFVRQERPAVTAVVISQLPPAVAAEVLQHLPPETSHEVLRRLSRLQDVDPETMSAIDEHLSQRLTEYQHHIQSDLENTRRIESLLAAAPTHIRQQWSDILQADSGHSLVTPDTLPSQSAASETLPETPRWSVAAQAEDVLDTGTQSAPGTASPPTANRGAASPPTANRGTADHGEANRRDDPRHVETRIMSPQPDSEEVDSDHADLLPFPQAGRNEKPTAVDRSLIQFEFEEILHLPPTMLAKLLSTTDSQFVLLALAGATPRFMKRFMNMLDRRDAKALQSRLQRIGPIRLRDVDEAQRRIVENAVQLSRQRPTQTELERRAAA